MRLQPFASIFAVVHASLFAAACTAGGATSSVAPDGGTEDTSPTIGDEGEPDKETASPAETAKEACEALIACIADVDPASAGAVVTLYGDASNCWKGSAQDAEACGKACVKSLEQRTECSGETLDRRYLALCTSPAGSEAMRFDVLLAFDPRKGGEATFRPLPIDADRYRSADALMTQPTILLEIESGGGAGASTKAFNVPGAAFDPYGGAPSTRVSRFAVSRLRLDDDNVCSDVEVEIVSPYQTRMSGACIYLPLAENAPIPRLSPSQIANCAP